MEEIRVIKCPFCGEMWTLEDNIPPAFCECFRCGQCYGFPNPIKMWKWVYDLVKTVKGS